MLGPPVIDRDRAVPDHGPPTCQERGDMDTVTSAAATGAGLKRHLPPVPDLTLPEFVLAGAQSRGSKVALADAVSGARLSYAALEVAVRETGAGLASRGIGRGEVLALVAPNSIDFAVTWFAATSIGAVVTTVNPQCTAAEVSRQLRQTSARHLVSTPALLAGELGKVAAAAGIARTFSIGGPAAGATKLESIRLSRAPQAAADSSDVAFLPASSGTTGLPKSVVLTHRNLVASLSQTRYAHRVTADDVVIAALPLFHIYGLQLILNLALLNGATVVILPRYDLPAFLRAISDHRVTRAEVVPPIVRALATSDAVDHYDLSSLRLLTSGAAPLDADLARACARRLGCRVKQAYGMTELGGATHVAPDGGQDRPGSIGPALPGIDCRIVDPGTGADVTKGAAGELLIRAPGTMRGYLNNPEATAATVDPGGWVHTGDIVVADADGWYHVTDRVKELIKYKGHQVAPAELEALLLTHPAVADAAVVGRPDDDAGEVPKAFIVLKSPASAAELTAWVAGRVAPYKQIRQVEFTSRIPVSPAGKILRRLLTESQRPGLSGTVAVVSGGGRGVGRLVAASLASAGAAVGLIARTPSELAATVTAIERAGGVAAGVAADLTDPDATAAAVAELRERLGRAELLINNAGISGPCGLLWETDPAQWWRTFEVNLGGAYALTRLVLPGMIAAGQGRIINITSHAGLYRWPLMSAYAASKAALVKLTETLAAETRPHGVAVFSVDPGLLPIGLSERAVSSTADPRTAEGQVFGWIRDQLASGRGADPAAAARLILSLAGGGADRLSGRHFCAADDVGALVAEIERIERDDLYTLRLRTGN
jgi:acyl-CoA synthetase (AMP-forming)/AMP-acid ligase II/NAD(P)-dependent dehydrogenase (short-subunit alcohol dehydrogenase family)